MPQTVVITGCSSGVGLASARLFQSKGWNVAATMRNPDCDAGKELAQLPNTAVFKLDLVDPDSIKSAITAAAEKFGSLNLLINNAGYGQYGVLEAISREQMLEQFQVNVFGVVDAIKAVMPYFRRNELVDGRRGTIVNVGSGASKFTLPIMSMYCASKHALGGLTEGISYELASQDVVIKLVIPHSGISSTNFNARGASSMANDPSLSSYNEYIGTVFGKYAGMIGDVTLDSRQVADLVFKAAKDQADPLHYYIGEDPLEIMKKKQSMSEEEYISFIRAMF